MHRYLRHLLGVLLVGIVGCLAAQAQPEMSWANATYRSYRFSLENVMHLAFFSGTESSEAEGRWERLPILAQKVRASEGATLRWPHSPETVEPVSLAWAVIAYIGWLRQIEAGCQRALLTPSVWRLIALTLGDWAAQALQFAEENLRDTQRGLYGQGWAAQIAMLHALSAFALGVTDSELYVGELSGIVARARADALFQSILKESDPPWPAELRLQALWVEALAWYALVGSYALEAVRVLHRVSAQLEGATSEQLSTRAMLLSALLVAHRLTGEGRYVARAERLWSELKNAWERAHELSVTELGDLAGAFNAVIRVLRLEEAKSEYARFFSFWGERLQIDDGEGSLGRAPVFVTKVAYDRERKLWSVLD
ncbi:MAG: hypothetical protein NZO41_01480, partial [Candidatus Bipolaricaulota bacterium]|nr:hypothetical protein [Candidatus Bipolaricaulota bacterium]